LNLNQTTTHSNSKRKKLKQEAVAKKLEDEILKDTKDFATLSLEKRWRLINYFFNELTFSDDL